MIVADQINHTPPPPTIGDFALLINSNLVN